MSERTLFPDPKRGEVEGVAPPCCPTPGQARTEAGMQRAAEGIHTFRSSGHSVGYGRGSVGRKERQRNRTGLSPESPGTPAAGRALGRVVAGLHHLWFAGVASSKSSLACLGQCQPQAMQSTQAEAKNPSLPLGAQSEAQDRGQRAEATGVWWSGEERPCGPPALPGRGRCRHSLSVMSPRPWAYSRSRSRVTSSFSSRISLLLGSSLMTALHRICLARSAYLGSTGSWQLSPAQQAQRCPEPCLGTAGPPASGDVTTPAGLSHRARTLFPLQSLGPLARGLQVVFPGPGAPTWGNRGPGRAGWHLLPTVRLSHLDLWSQDRGSRSNLQGYVKTCAPAPAGTTQAHRRVHVTDECVGFYRDPCPSYLLLLVLCGQKRPDSADQVGG